MKNIKYIASCSFGKDSLAMVIMLIKKNYPLDEVVFYDTGMEFDAIYKNEEKLKKILNKKGIGYKKITPEKSFRYLAFEHEHKKSDGTCVKGYGWCGGIRRWGTGQKIREVEKYYKKKYGENVTIIEYVGIASDELERCEKSRKKRSNAMIIYPLIEWGMKEKDCLSFCYEHNIKWEQNGVDLYKILDRVSCWCCSNKNQKEIENIINFLPDVWENIKKYENKCGVPYKGRGCKYFEEKFKG